MSQALARELALIGIQHADRLDPQGQKLMREMLTAMEKAYRSGRAALKPGAAAPPPVPNDTDARALLVEAGLTPADFEKLQNLAKLSGEEACELGIKLNATPSKLPPDKARAAWRAIWRRRSNGKVRRLDRAARAGPRTAFGQASTPHLRCSVEMTGVS